MKLKLQNFLAKKENIYLTLALTFGLMMALFNPPFAGVPDEHAHFWKAWSVADGYWRCSGQDAIPQSAATLPNEVRPMKIPGVSGTKIVVKGLRDFLFAKSNAEQAVIGGAICSTAPIGFLPQAVGLNLGRLLDLSALGSFYLARLVTLLAAILITFWAIKIMPFGKIIFVIIALLPMTMQQYASLSYDALHISLLFLFTAFVFKLAHEKEKLLSKKEIALLLLLSIFGLNIKLGYGVVSLMIFVLPISKFRTKKQYWTFTSLFVLFNVVTVLLFKMLFPDMSTPDDAVNPAEQIRFVLSNPLNFLYVSFNTIYIKAFSFLEMFLYKPGWLKTSMEPIWYVFMILGIGVLLKNNKEEIPLSKKQRLIVLGTFAVAMLTTFFALYIAWTKVGAEKIAGLQGRYFLSVAPLMFLAFYKKEVTKKVRENLVTKNIMAALVIFFVISYFFVFQKIYTFYYQKIVTKSIVEKVK